MTGKKVVETIPARNQNCKTNYISSIQLQRMPTKREKLAHEGQLQQQQMALQYSYNSWGDKEGNSSKHKTVNTDRLSMTQVWRNVNHR